MNIIEIRGLKKAYPGFSLDIGALDLPEGCILGLVGENGAGKTTTIRLLLGLARPDDGRMSLPEKALLGVVPDEPGIPGLTADELGRVLARVYKNWDRPRYAALLARLDVPRSKPFDKLSRGTKQKLGIAAAMSHGARVLILDEPMNGLDPVAREEVDDLLLDFAREEGNAVLISSHIVSDLEKICDYVAFLHRGQVLLCEEKDRLAASCGLLRCPKERLDELDPAALLTRRDTPYFSEAVVRRDGVPAAAELLPVSIEDIFVAMVKGDRK